MRKPKGGNMVWLIDFAGGNMLIDWFCRSQYVFAAGHHAPADALSLLYRGQVGGRRQISDAVLENWARVQIRNWQGSMSTLLPSVHSTSLFLLWFIVSTLLPCVYSASLCLLCFPVSTLLPCVYFASLCLLCFPVSTLLPCFYSGSLCLLCLPVLTLFILSWFQVHHCHSADIPPVHDPGLGLLCLHDY